MAQNKKINPQFYTPNDIMFDLETYSTRNDAAIVQIGACKLDESSSFIVSINPEYYNRTSGKSPYFHVDPATVQWWGMQPKEARDALEINRVESLEPALAAFTRWVTSNLGQGNYVWAYPPQFDVSIIRHAYGQILGSTDKTPWSYRQERCARTFIGFFGRGTTWAEDGLIKHRADHDSIRQARRVIAAAERLKAHTV